MRKISAAVCFILLVSCELLGDGVPRKEQLVKEEMESINWNDVDRYPLFDGCDETKDKEIQKQCFETTFIGHLLDTLQKQKMVVHKALHDTVNVQLLIDQQGVLSILSIEKSELVQKQIPQLDSIIAQSLTTLPTLYPALKRDIPVATKLNLPIVLKVD